MLPFFSLLKRSPFRPKLPVVLIFEIELRLWQTKIGAEEDLYLERRESGFGCNGFDGEGSDFLGSGSGYDVGFDFVED